MVCRPSLDASRAVGHRPRLPRALHGVERAVAASFRLLPEPLDARQGGTAARGRHRRDRVRAPRRLSIPRASGRAPSAGLGSGDAAAAPIAFAFDGWSSAVSIAPELKDAQREPSPSARDWPRRHPGALPRLLHRSTPSSLGPRRSCAPATQAYRRSSSSCSAPEPPRSQSHRPRRRARHRERHGPCHAPHAVLARAARPDALRVAHRPREPHVEVPPRERVHGARMLGLLARGPHRRDRRRPAAQRGEGGHLPRLA